MKRINCWNEEEIKKLFSIVEECKKKNRPTSHAFKEYATLSSRKPDSVRNYYYQQLAFFEENESEAEKLNIDLSKHKIVKGKTFTNEESKKLIDEITKLKNQGYSVRKACLKLANNDVSEMIRLQNKYRSMTMSTPVKNDKLDNITIIPKRTNKLTDSDINSLFLGLVNMVKRNARSEADINLKREVELANDALRRMMVELGQKELEIKKLRTQFTLLTQEKEDISKKLTDLQSKSASLSQELRSKKLEELKTHLTNTKEEILM